MTQHKANWQFVLDPMSDSVKLIRCTCGWESQNIVFPCYETKEEKDVAILRCMNEFENHLLVEQG